MAEADRPPSNLPELVPAAVFMEDVNSFMQGVCCAAPRAAERETAAAAAAECSLRCRCCSPAL